MSRLTTWYKGLNEREKPMVNLLALIIILFAIYLLIIMPIKSYMNQLSEDEEYYQTSLTDISMQAKALSRNRTNPNSNSKQTLNQLVNLTANRYQLKLKNISETKRNKELQVRLDDAEFDQLLRWVLVLENQHALTIDTLRVSDTDDVGKVDVSLKIIKI